MFASPLFIKWCRYQWKTFIFIDIMGKIWISFIHSTKLSLLAMEKKICSIRDYWRLLLSTKMLSCIIHFSKKLAIVYFPVLEKKNYTRTNRTKRESWWKLHLTNEIMGHWFWNKLRNRLIKRTKNNFYLKSMFSMETYSIKRNRCLSANWTYYSMLMWIHSKHLSIIIILRPYTQ